MIRFETYDLLYTGNERFVKTSQSPARRKPMIFHVIQFLDTHTNRAIYVYDWSGLEPDLEERQKYYVQGFVNFRHRTSFLVVDGIARLVDGVKYLCHKDIQGISKIECKQNA